MDQKRFDSMRERERDRQRWNNIYRIYIRYSQQRRNRQLPGLCVCVWETIELLHFGWLTTDFLFLFFLFEIWKMEELLLLLLLLYQVTPTLPKKVLVEICENSLFLFSFNVSVDVCDVDTRLSISKVRLMWSYSQKWNEWDSQLFVCLSTVQLLRRLVKGQKRGPRND
jgi:hypothetical protein